MLNASCQVAENRIHGVPGLLPGDTQILLKSASHGRENGLGRLMGIHGDGGPSVFPLSQSTDMREGILGGDDKTRFALAHPSLVFKLLVESIIVTTSVRSGEMQKTCALKGKKKW